MIDYLKGCMHKKRLGVCLAHSILYELAVCQLSRLPFCFGALVLNCHQEAELCLGKLETQLGSWVGGWVGGSVCTHCCVCVCVCVVCVCVYTLL